MQNISFQTHKFIFAVHLMQALNVSISWSFSLKKIIYLIVGIEISLFGD